jgi:short-subunit dehydrogenase
MGRIDRGRRVAVVGAGIAGLGAARALARSGWRMTLWEAEAQLGGHARTRHGGRRGDQPVDTGFIVFNHATYPRLSALCSELDLPLAPAAMNFAVPLAGGRFEYGLPRRLMVQPPSLLDPRFLGLLADVLRFSARAGAAAAPGMTVAERLGRLSLGGWFRDRYLVPLAGAIWGTGREGVLGFPALAMARFLETHRLMSLGPRRRWFTIAGGSRLYVERLAARLAAAGVERRVRAPLRGVRRGPSGPEIRAQGGDWERCDALVLALHPKEALALRALSARQRARLEELAAELPGRARALPLDLHDGVVLAAGAYWPLPAADWDAARAEEIGDTNFLGAMRVAGAVLPGMIARRNGHLVVLGSLAALRGCPGAAAYSASKAAVVALAEGLRADCEGTGVLVQLVNPGFVRTRLTAKNRFRMPFLMEPEAAARAIVEPMTTGRFQRDFPLGMAALLRAGRLLPPRAWARLASQPQGAPGWRSRPTRWVRSSFSPASWPRRCPRPRPSSTAPSRASTRTRASTWWP